jgi:type II secretion system (T2SS) protein M
MTLVKRIAHEKRAIVWPLVLLVLVNVGAYAGIVYPLERRAAGAADRAASADAARRSAERDLTASRTLVSNQTVARDELATFYDKVLPQNYVEARSMTYKRLPELAKKANVRYEAGSFELDQTVKNARVGRLHTKMVLEGDYESFRQFVYDVETASDFIIIDSVTLAQGEVGKPLTLNLELSTYFRIANGT